MPSDPSTKYLIAEARKITETAPPNPMYHYVHALADLREKLEALADRWKSRRRQNEYISDAEAKQMLYCERDLRDLLATLETRQDPKPHNYPKSDTYFTET